jgi:uncharacterized protein (TIGR02270 family)
MTAPAATFIADIAEEHVEELQFLWGQRERALRSPQHTMRTLAALEERIEGHVQGLLAIGDRMLPIVEPSLSADDAAAAFAGAYPLLRLGSDAAITRALGALTAATGAKLDGVRRAFALAPVDRLMPQLHALATGSAPLLAAAAAEVLTFHGVQDVARRRVAEWVCDEDPTVRRSAWRIIGYLGATIETAWYAAALRDDDDAVKRTAIAAVPWTALADALALARRLADAPAPEHLPHLELLAILGSVDDAARIAAIAGAAPLGPARFRLVGAFGHPGFVDFLLGNMASPDPATAVAAGEAFTKMTGAEIASTRQATIAPAGAAGDDFETEFHDVVTLPDPELARRHWARMAPTAARAQRLACGYDLAAGLGPDAFSTLDLESRWEIFVRSRFYGAWTGSPMNLEVFPQWRGAQG